MAVSARTAKRIELTYRGIILGALITVIFTAANVYFGLKVGLTFATSLPAAVISMAILRFFRNSTIWENNIVQTIASAAGTLSSIIFVLPGLVMVGWWTGFPFWQSFGICAVGGILGVMYSVPLRRAMVTGSDLPYPEGVAAAEVLRVGAAATSHEGADPAAVAENKAGFTTIVWSSVVSLALFMIVATNVFAGEIKHTFRTGVTAVTGLDVGLSLALIGVGHLVGVTVGIAMLAGIVLAWGVLMPMLSSMHAGTGPDLASAVNDVFRHRVRFIGAGAIGVAAIWSLGRLAGPVVGGVMSSLRASRARSADPDGDLPITERDIPFNIVAIISAVCLIPLGVLLAAFLSGGVIAERRGTAGDRRHRLHRHRRHPRRRGLRLHGGSDRVVQLAGVGARDPDDLGRRTAAGRARASGRSECGESAGRVRAVRHGDRHQHRDDLQRQLARPQDGSARRRHAVAPAGRADLRRDLRLAGDPVAARHDQPRLRLPRLADEGHHRAAAGRAAGDADLGARARRHHRRLAVAISSGSARPSGSSSSRSTKFCAARSAVSFRRSPSRSESTFRCR